MASTPVMAAFKPLPLTSPTAITTLPSEPRKYLVEVSANFLRGQISGFNVAAGKSRDRFWDQPLLDLARGIELGGSPFVLKSDAAMTEQQDRADGDQEEEHRQVVRIESQSARHGNS